MFLFILILIFINKGYANLMKMEWIALMNIKL